MATNFEKIEALALALPIKERSELAHKLIVSLNGEAEGTPEEIAKAWDEEIARRVAEIDAGTAVLFSEDEVFAEIDDLLRRAEK